MAINRVSFGNIFTVAYRYRTDDTNGERNAARKYRESTKALSLRGCLVDECPVNKVSDIEQSPDYRFYHKANILITGDDKETVPALYYGVSPDIAEKYIDKNAETIIIDV